MSNLKTYWPRLKAAIPYLYFMFIIISQFLTNSHPNGRYILILLLPFVFHLVYPKTMMHVFLGAFLFMVSLYFVFAFLSDAVKIQNLNPQAISFMIGGTLFVSLNLLMAGWIMYGNLIRIRSK